MKVLKQGSYGPQVELLQLALTRAGYSPGEIDGIFGNATRSALIRFQRSAGIVADGVAGPQTWNALTPWLTGYVTHAVRRGDTFYSLASSFGTSIRAIDTANPGVDPLSLQIGTKLIIPLAFDVVPTNISFTSTVLDYCVRGLKARYPFIMTGSIGNSVLGKTIYYLRIGEGNTETFYNAAHHANEWITSPLLMKYLENYARACAFGGKIAGADAAGIYASARLYIVPMVNPDGVDLVTGEIAAGSQYYERAQTLSRNYPDIPFPSGWKSNINGVDLNLQYPASWEKAKEVKFAQGFTLPGPRDYVGTAPLSQPESLAVYKFTLIRNFSLSLSYHTQGNVIYWKYLDYEPANSLAIGRRFASLSGYSLELTPEMSGYAGYKDWFIQQYNLPGYTIEVGSGISPLPLSQFDTIYSDNGGILTEAQTITTQF